MRTADRRVCTLGSSSAYIFGAGELNGACTSPQLESLRLERFRMTRRGLRRLVGDPIRQRTERAGGRTAVHVPRGWLSREQDATLASASEQRTRCMYSRARCLACRAPDPACAVDPLTLPVRDSVGMSCGTRRVSCHVCGYGLRRLVLCTRGRDASALYKAQRPGDTCRCHSAGFVA